MFQYFMKCKQEQINYLLSIIVWKLNPDPTVNQRLLPFDVVPVAWQKIYISFSIFRSLIYTNLIFSIYVHQRRGFDIAFCYSAPHLLWDYDLSFCVQHALYYPESLTNWSQEALLVHLCLCVHTNTQTSPSVDLPIDNRSPCCILWVYMLGGINNLLPRLVSPLWLPEQCTVALSQLHGVMKVPTNWDTHLLQAVFV